MQNCTVTNPAVILNLKHRSQAMLSSFTVYTTSQHSMHVHQLSSVLFNNRQPWPLAKQHAPSLCDIGCQRFWQPQSMKPPHPLTTCCKMDGTDRIRNCCQDSVPTCNYKCVMRKELYNQSDSVL